MDDITFCAGLWLLASDQASQLQELLSTIADPEVRHSRASAFIRERVDPVELVRTAAAVRAGLLDYQLPVFAQSARAGRSG
jgi:hypothetical protein